MYHGYFSMLTKAITEHSLEVALQAWIWEMLDSNHGWDTSYTDDFHVFSQSLQTKDKVVSQGMTSVYQNLSHLSAILPSDVI